MSTPSAVDFKKKSSAFGSIAVTQVVVLHTAQSMNLAFSVIILRDRVKWCRVLRTSCIGKKRTRSLF